MKTTKTRHVSEASPFRVEAKLRNNRLALAREELGYTSIKAAADAFQLNYPTLVDYEGFKISPWDKKGGWKESAEKIAASYGYSCEELWPDVVANVVKPRVMFELAKDMAVIDAPPDGASMQKQLSESVAAVLNTLAPQEQKVIVERFGLYGQEEKTLKEIGKDLKVQQERTRQIEAKALRKLRDSSRSKQLKPYVESDEPQSATVRNSDSRVYAVTIGNEEWRVNYAAARNGRFSVEGAKRGPYCTTCGSHLASVAEVTVANHKYQDHVMCKNCRKGYPMREYSS